MPSSSTEQVYLSRIAHSLSAAAAVVEQFQQQTADAESRLALIRKLELDLSHALRESLLQPGEGWLCEEHADDEARLGCDVVWIVDPIDGTAELVNGVPEWSISVGLVLGTTPVAGGIYNPSTRELILGSLHEGVTYNGQHVQPNCKHSLDGAVVLASRQEMMRGEWTRFQERNFTVRPTGSVAYKLALVAAGLADATWTLSPKHEWDVAAGVALVRASGGRVSFPGDQGFEFNQRQTLLPGLVASCEGVWNEVNSVLAEPLPSAARQVV